MANNDEGETPKRNGRTFSKEAADEVKREVLFGVGYRRPPEQTRFKKGQSGNPKGRPKRPDCGAGGSRLARDLILREAERLVTIRDGDETRQIPVIEAILRAATKSAASGNAYAQKHMIERFAWADLERRAEIEEFERFLAGVRLPAPRRDRGS